MLVLGKVLEIMPTYSYECEECGHAFDVVQGMKDKPKKKCPKCKKMKLQKVILGVGGIRFKGDGFHGTDYGKYGPKEKEN